VVSLADVDAHQAQRLYVGGLVSQELAVIKQMVGLLAALMFVALVLGYSRRSQ
jgi:hypothetical protein